MTDAELATFLRREHETARSALSVAEHAGASLTVVLWWQVRAGLLTYAADMIAGTGGAGCGAGLRATVQFIERQRCFAAGCARAAFDDHEADAAREWAGRAHGYRLVEAALQRRITSMAQADASAAAQGRAA